MNKVNTVILGMILISGMTKKKPASSSSTSNISSAYINNVIEKLKGQQVRNTTSKNYLSIWRHFNRFLLRLDVKPDAWEDRTAMFCAYLIDKGIKSTTIRCYISAIKAILRDDSYPWQDGRVIFSSMTRACKLKNDTLHCRLPILTGLLEMLLFEVQRMYKNQFYHQILYQALFSMAYYGLMRVGELTQGDHPVKACDVHAAQNKKKILIILRTSKTHGLADYPQQIKISAKTNTQSQLFCPFMAIQNFITIRGDYLNESENLFIFRDKSPVKPEHMRATLKACLQAIGVDPSLYDCHSFRIGRSTQMWKMKFSIQEIRRAGRWRSSAIYKYLRQ